MNRGPSSRHTVAHFATTPRGQHFFQLYAQLRDRWPADTIDLDLPSRFGTTRVTVSGPVAGSPVILLPGNGASMTAWHSTIGHLSSHHRCYAIDFIGDIGRSVPDGDPITSVTDLYEWLSTTIDSANVRTPTLIGHSYGAMIALGSVLAQPDRAARLVLLDPNSCFGGLRADYLWHALPTLLAPTQRRHQRFLAWETGGRVLDPTWVELAAMGAEYFPTTRPRVPARPSAAALASLAVPTTVLLANASRAHNSAAIATRAQELIPGATVETIDGATHHSMPMIPAERIGRAVVDALRR